MGAKSLASYVNSIHNLSRRLRHIHALFDQHNTAGQLVQHAEEGMALIAVDSNLIRDADALLAQSTPHIKITDLMLRVLRHLMLFKETRLREYDFFVDLVTLRNILDRSKIWTPKHSDDVQTAYECATRLLYHGRNPALGAWESAAEVAKAVSKFDRRFSGLVTLMSRDVHGISQQMDDVSRVNSLANCFESDFAEWRSLDHPSLIFAISKDVSVFSTCVAVDEDALDFACRRTESCIVHLASDFEIRETVCATLRWELECFQQVSMQLFEALAKPLTERLAAAIKRESNAAFLAAEHLDRLDDIVAALGSTVDYFESVAVRGGELKMVEQCTLRELVDTVPAFQKLHADCKLLLNPIEIIKSTVLDCNLHVGARKVCMAYNTVSSYLPPYTWDALSDTTRHLERSIVGKVKRIPGNLRSAGVAVFGFLWGPDALRVVTLAELGPRNLHDYLTKLKLVACTDEIISISQGCEGAGMLLDIVFSKQWVSRIVSDHAIHAESIHKAACDTLIALSAISRQLQDAFKTLLVLMHKYDLRPSEGLLVMCNNIHVSLKKGLHRVDGVNERVRGITVEAAALIPSGMDGGSEGMRKKRDKFEEFDRLMGKDLNLWSEVESLRLVDTEIEDFGMSLHACLSLCVVTKMHVDEIMRPGAVVIHEMRMKIADTVKG